MLGLTDAFHIGFSAGLTSVTTAGLGLFVILRNRASRLYRIFAAYSIAISFWSLLLSLHVFSESRGVALFTGRFLHIGAAIIPVMFVHFVDEFFSDGQRRYGKYCIGGLYVCGLALVILCVSGIAVPDVAPKYGIAFLMVPGPGHILLVGFFVLCAVWGLIRLYIGYRDAVGVRKNQIKYLLVGSAFGYLGGLDNFLYLYDITIFPLFPYGTYAVPIYVSSTAYAIAQYRLLDIAVAIKKSLIYALLLVILLVPCYLIVIGAQKLTFGTVSYGFSISTLFLFILVGFFFPKLRFRTEDALERALFKKRIDYRETLLRSSRDMVSFVDINALADNVVRTVSNSLGIDKVSILLGNESKSEFSLQSNIGLDIDRAENVSLPKESPLVQLLQRRCEPIVKEELEWVPVDHETPHTIEIMDKLDAELSIPIISKDQLVGVLNLGHKDDNSIYSNEDLELLSTLANQAAIAIENARLYENLKQSQATLRRADRLSSLGLLTAGLAHEIRNPLVAIRTFTQLLPERYNDAEFREGFQGLALKEVDRICGLINDLLSFARPSKPNVAPENVNDVVDGIARILETQAKEKNVAIVREFDADLPKAWIDREQMKQVFMNLILNGIQAMAGGGTITVATRQVSRKGAELTGEFVQVEIRDTGIGIPEENLDHIFDPFFTSKDEGSGLGLSVSHQIVQEHGGFVTVESQVGKGTSFFVHMPIGRPAQPVSSDNAQANEANPYH